MLFRELFALDAEVQVVHLDGHASGVAVTRLALAENLAAGTLTFVKNAKFLKKLHDKLRSGPLPAAGALFDRKLWESLDASVQGEWRTLLGIIAVSGNVPLTMTLLSKPLYELAFGDCQSMVDGRQMGTCQIHPSALVAQGAFIGEHVKLAAGVVIHPGVTIAPRVEIGENTVIYANVAIYPNTVIGKNVRVHANCSIGADGFGYVFDKGVHHKIWHTGGVVIHDDVEIGANSTVDMGTFAATVIGAGTRIDNQVQIAHNVKIGKGCILCGQAGMAGSAVLEDFVVLGGRAAIGPEAHIGLGSQVAGGAIVNEGAVWPAGSVLGGHPARDLKEWMRTFAWLRKNALKT